MDILNTDFLPGGRWVARYVKNAFGVDEAIRLPETHWKHFDWLKSIGTDMDKFTMECDVNRHINQEFFNSFSGYVEEMLVNDEAYRHRAGKEVPLHINPYRCESEKKILFHEEIQRREVTDANGELVELRIPRGYWQYLDWLGRHGTDVAKYIIDADQLRHEPKWKGRTLAGMLTLLLLEDEKKRYFSNEPSPLYICPEGYEE